MNSAYPPFASLPVPRKSAQRFSFPARQNLHFPHAEKIQATPTRSPSRCRLAFFPAAAILPTIWWPGTIGKNDGGVRPSISSSSVWHTPQANTRSKTSFSLGDGFSISEKRNGCELSSTLHISSRTIAFMHPSHSRHFEETTDNTDCLFVYIRVHSVSSVVNLLTRPLAPIEFDPSAHETPPGWSLAFHPFAERCGWTKFRLSISVLCHSDTAGRILPQRHKEVYLH